MTRPTLRRARALLIVPAVALVALGAVVAGCGNDSSPPSAAPPAAAPAPPGAQSNLAQIARDQGVSFDQVFIDNMIPHHQSAIEMARVELAKGRNPELRKIATDIVASQDGEITQMRAWRQAWFGSPDTPATPSMGMAGMDPGRVAAASDVDRAFVDEMTPHHQGAVEMAREAQTASTRPEIRALAGAIITAQEREIAEFARLRAQL